MLEYTFKFYNIATGKVITKKAQGSSRLKALIYLMEKIRKPQNLLTLEVSSAL